MATQVSLTVTSEDSNKGSAYGSRQSINAGTRVLIKAVANKGYKFSGWTVSYGNASHLEDATAATTHYYAAENASLVAHFEAVPDEGYYVGYYADGTFHPCELRYFDGTGWKKCEIYYYDGTGWKPCSIK